MKQIIDAQTTLDTITGQVEEVTPQPRPVWASERDSPGEPRKGAKPEAKIPKQHPGRRWAQ